MDTRSADPAAVSIARLDFLWESGDPLAALERRFGWASLPAAADALAALARDHYGVTVESIDRLSISAANAVAWLRGPAGPLIFKICIAPKGHGWLAARTRLVVWLKGRGQPVATMLEGERGEHQIQSGRFSLSLQGWLDGRHLDPGDAEQARAAGVTLARLHLECREYPRQSDFAPLSVPNGIGPFCDELAGWLAGVPGEHAPLVQALERIKRQWGGAGLENLPQGICHRDYRAANLLVSGGDIQAVLDFETARWDTWINDLSHAMVFLGTMYRGWAPVEPAIQREFLAGYTSLRPLSEAELAIMPALIQLHSIELGRATNTEAARRVSLERAGEMTEKAKG
jgi:homoserine kinase type II